MDKKNKKYYRYQMTFPTEGNKIYKSRSINKVIRKCYDEYKNYNDIDEGMFCVTNLDKDVEYKFKVNDNKIKKIKQKGGSDVKRQTEEILALEEGEPNNENNNNGEINQKIATILATIENSNAKMNEIDDINANVQQIATKLENNDEQLANINLTLSKINIPKEQPKHDETRNSSNSLAPSFGKDEPCVMKDIFDDLPVYEYNLRKLDSIAKLNKLDHDNNSCIIC